MEIKEKEELQKAWLKSAIEDLETAKDLFKLRRFSGCLFFCHLVIEKTLKAIYIKVNDTYPPLIHKLAKLAIDSKVELTDEQVDNLNEITTFNVEARYDIFKEKLYKKANVSYATRYLQITMKLFTYFKTKL
jgi:HEPN domain-containing protein